VRLEQLQRKSIPTGQDLRVRLARLEGPRPGDPSQGPFVAAEQGFRIFYGLGGHREKNASEDMLAQLNGPSHVQQ